MCPVKFELDGVFYDEVKNPGSGIVLHTDPEYYFSWSGDDSIKQEVSVWRLDPLSKTKQQIASAVLPRVGDFFSMEISVVEKVDFPKESKVAFDKTLLATRVE